MIYKTEFINDRATRVQVIDQEMRVVLELRAGDRRFIEGDNPENMFSRYSKITYLPEGKVEVEKNKNWENPYGGGWSIELVNLSSTDAKIKAGDEYFFTPSGLARTVRLKIFLPFIRFSEIRLRDGKTKIPDRKSPGVFVEMGTVIMDKVERPKAELDEIDRQLKDRAGLPK